jgi:serine protease Do
MRSRIEALRRHPSAAQTLLHPESEATQHMARRICYGSILALVLFIAAQPLSAQPSSLPATFRTAAAAIIPSVIEITLPLENEFDEIDAPDPRISTWRLLKGLLGERLEADRRTVAVGVVLDPRGLALTSAHNLQGADDIQATAADGTVHRVTVVGVDEKTDLAVIRLSGAGPFPYATLADSDTMRVGDWVLAISAPYGLGTTVTAGVIGATGRARPLAPIDEWFQTDAFTYADSAGGPLVNLRGEVVAFSTVLASAEIGVGFAIPSNLASPIYRQLAQRGRILRNSLDARVQPLTPGLAEALGVRERRGLLVSDVATHGAGERAGLRHGDILLTLGGTPLEMPYDLDRALRAGAPGQPMTLTVRRDGHEQTVRVDLASESSVTATRPLAASVLGFDVRPITPDFGVVVTRVDPSGPAAAAGLRAGDIVREITFRIIYTIGDFHRATETLREGEWLAVLVQRGQLALYLAVAVGKH